MSHYTPISQIIPPEAYVSAFDRIMLDVKDTIPLMLSGDGRQEYIDKTQVLLRRGNVVNAINPTNSNWECGKIIRTNEKFTSTTQYRRSLSNMFYMSSERINGLSTLSMVTELDRMSKKFAEHIYQSFLLGTFKPKIPAAFFYSPHFTELYVKGEAKRYWNGMFITSWLRSMPTPIKNMMHSAFVDQVIDDSHCKGYKMYHNAQNDMYDILLAMHSSGESMDERMIYPDCYVDLIDQTAHYYNRCADFIHTGGDMQMIYALIVMHQSVRATMTGKLQTDQIRNDITYVRPWTERDEIDELMCAGIAKNPNNRYVKSVDFVINKHVKPLYKDMSKNYVQKLLDKSPNVTDGQFIKFQTNTNWYWAPRFGQGTMKFRNSQRVEALVKSSTKEVAAFYPTEQAFKSAKNMMLDTITPASHLDTLTKIMRTDRSHVYKISSSCFRRVLL